MFPPLPTRTAPPRLEALPTDSCVVCGEPCLFETREQLHNDEWACGYLCEARWFSENDACPKRRLLSMLDLPHAVARITLADGREYEGFVSCSWDRSGGRTRRVIAVDDPDRARMQEFGMDEVSDARLVEA